MKGYNKRKGVSLEEARLKRSVLSQRSYIVQSSSQIVVTVLSIREALQRLGCSGRWSGAFPKFQTLSSKLVSTDWNHCAQFWARTLPKSKFLDTKLFLRVAAVHVCFFTQICFQVLQRKIPEQRTSRNLSFKVDLYSQYYGKIAVFLNLVFLLQNDRHGFSEVVNFNGKHSVYLIYCK